MSWPPVWSDFETGRALDLTAWPHVDGVPVLVPEARAFLARHGPRMGGHGRNLAEVSEPLPIDAPDPLTPHLPPGRWPEVLLPEGPLGEWVAALGETCPDALCARWGQRWGPEGVSLDAGCGVGSMALRMAQAGRSVVAFDRSPAAVLLARALLAGRHTSVHVPLARSSSIELAWPHAPVSPDATRWAVADVLAPPLPPDSLAWIHLGSVVDMVSASPFDVVDAVAPLLQSGGLLTVATPHDEDRMPAPGVPDPSRALRDVLEALGLDLVAEERAVPWVVRQYDRGYRVLLTDCLAARASW